MKRYPIALLPIFVLSCAHLPARNGDEAVRAELWNEAHISLYNEAFARADSVFAQIAARFPATDEGREARFYIGALHLDPRNPNWSSQRTETALRQYLDQDTVGGVIHRRPEALTLLELARQLNLPPDERVSGLQPGTLIVQQRVVAPAGQQRELAEENERLRQMVDDRDEQIRRQREELERIRRALAPRNS